MSEGRKIFGQELSRLRTERGVSLEELASATKVRAVLLRALEEGRFEDLPPAVFVEGYLKACARFLDAKPEPLLERYRTVAGVPSLSAPSAQTFRAAQAEPGGSRWLGWVGAILLVGGLSWASYVLIEQWRTSSIVIEPSAASSSGAEEPPPVSEEHPAGSAPLAQPQPAREPAASEAGGAVTATLQSVPSAAPPSAVPESPEPATETPTLADPSGDLVLLAREACWCEIWADGQRILYRQVAPGERLGLSGRRFKVNLGNAGAVELRFRGVRVALPAGEGQVVKGLDLPAPEASPQP